MKLKEVKRKLKEWTKEHKEKQKEKMELAKAELHTWQTISEHSQSEDD